ncbi:MAG TPA: hypothetical protein VGD83_32810 [Streptosporangiaceae bacterium]
MSQPVPARVRSSPFGEQVAHRARLAAEEVAEQRIDAERRDLAVRLLLKRATAILESIKALVDIPGR